MNSIPFICAIFHENALTIELERDREDFWVNLGEFAGWGRFRNRDRVWHKGEEVLIPLGVKIDPATVKRPPVKEHVFLLVEVVPAHSPPPSPIVCASNVLWRKREALEVLAKQNAYLRGLENCD
ncbi:hypothetical protein EDC59_11397 [Pseudodesulfovibrio indicus]|uniref:Uncharacterized protein n=1 Tax=Pseudodesulfovibrio indicus TaxID=1716143 RepID=A0AA94PJ05_9BACT|nr:hypothetical protein EDC59_11397 [Pseudodesulfovibrio indicus]